jgi:hypothetical protein
MHAILTIAHLTLAEARRRRIVLAALLCALALLVLFSTAVFSPLVMALLKCHSSSVRRFSCS